VHLGLIGGIGPAATEHYYRQLVASHTRAGRRLELTIAHADLNELLRNLRMDARQVQADVFRDIAHRLRAAGADVVGITSMAGHFCVREFEAVSPLPVISALDAIRDELLRRSVRTVGVLGTEAAMTSNLFGGLEGFDVRVPAAEMVGRTDREYIAMARTGRASEVQRAFFIKAGHALHEAGAEVVLLAGTDLFLAFDGRDCGVTTLDCATIHVNALTMISMSGASNT
jgi:aspartate racemase